ncbi:hypothetical protein DICVIV_13457 [Dictyocaulus viviparus]|uniref:Uncharacterized protein n=1 Tax=Dictyocaulus viviparus TaxID=29172 RepID=A0A0D8XDR3_DICVI|nr:hypothetical protein DICVIV_13457 [Dictyocaulus viviparus]
MCTPIYSWLRLKVQTNEDILYDVATTFWFVFVFYVFASIAWIIYCVVSYRRDVEMYKMIAENNNIARYLELRRLLRAYDSVDIENTRLACEENHMISE